MPISDYQRQAYSFFTTRAAVQMKLNMPAGKWSQLALQLSTSAPVFYAIAALGGVFHGLVQRTHVNFVKPACGDQRALEEYGRAMVALHRLLASAEDNNGSSLEPVLLTCLLFVSFEFCQSNSATALAHLNLGSRLARACTEENGCGKGLMARCMKTAAELLSLFDEMEDDQGFSGVQRAFVWQRQGVRLDEGKQVPSCDLRPTAFSSTLASSIRSSGPADLEDASTNLCHLISAGKELQADILSIAQTASKEWYPAATGAYRDCANQCLARIVALPHYLEARLRDLQAAYTVWKREYRPLCSQSHQVLMAPVDQIRVTLMQIQHFYHTFLLATSRETEEYRSDRFTLGFTEVLNLIEQYLSQTAEQIPAFSPGRRTPNLMLDGRILPTLFLVAVKCRDQTVRRRAMKILRASERNENFQVSRTLAGLAEWIIKAEEKRAKAITRSEVFGGEIPEAARFCDVVIEARYSEPEDIRFVFGRFTSDAQSDLEIGEEIGRGEDLNIHYISKLHGAKERSGDNC
jgi:hypothetical protein